MREHECNYKYSVLDYLAKLSTDKQRARCPSLSVLCKQTAELLPLGNVKSSAHRLLYPVFLLS